MSGRRVRLEIEEIKEWVGKNSGFGPLLQTIANKKLGTSQYVFRFFLNDEDEEQLKEHLKQFKDKLYSGYKIYKANEFETFFGFVSVDSHQKPTKKTFKLFNDILTDDNEAILNAQDSDEFIRMLCDFKLRVMEKKDKSTIEELLNPDGDSLFN